MKQNREQAVIALVYANAVADPKRLIRAGLLNSDNETLREGLSRVEQIAGTIRMEEALFLTIVELSEKGLI